MRSKFWKRAVFPLLLTGVFAASVFSLFAGDDVSYLDAACTFEGKNPGCLDSLPEWNSGLRHFDSVLLKTEDTAAALNSLLWNFWRLEFAGDGLSAQPSSVLPLSVLKKRTSGCMGTVFLALMVGEARGLRMEPVLLPGHVFFRVNGKNEEPNRKGFRYSDEEYRQKYADGPWTGFEFSPLSAKRFLGLVAFNLGNASRNENSSVALSWYQVASELFPEYPGIAANRRIVLEKQR